MRTTTIPLRRWLGLLVTVLTVGCSTALPAAQSGTTPAYADDSPPLIAGRVAAIDGDVRIWRTEEDGDGAWDRAQLNDVVTVGTGLAADDGRTEVRVGPHAFRLGAGSVGGFSQLDFGAKTFNLERGVINIRLAPAQQGEAVAVVVAGVRIDLAAPGNYRVDAVDNAPLNFTVFQGQGVVRYGTNNVTVNSNQALVMTQSSMNFAAVVTTPLDEWAFARDARFQQVPAARYVSPYMTGYEELDAHGDWVPDATFGTVWMPRSVPVGWAPYRDGRWRWVQPWGWTWVDAAPWGYAPFHYGRWVVIGNRWGWWPGSFVARPVWAPALVGFVGGGTISCGRLGFGRGASRSGNCLGAGGSGRGSTRRIGAGCDSVVSAPGSGCGGATLYFGAVCATPCPVRTCGGATRPAGGAERTSSDTGAVRFGRGGGAIGRRSATFSVCAGMRTLTIGSRKRGCGTQVDPGRWLMSGGVPRGGRWMIVWLITVT